MPIYRLTSELLFPPPEMAEKSGLLAIGGDLSPERLLQAYSRGIFPWFSPGDPLLWWSPDPRTIFVPGEMHIPRRLQRTIRQGRYTVRADSDFKAVISSCATITRRHEKGTWITGGMLAAYNRLHELGFAHSIECWQNGELAGGLYGVAIGRAFFGESMFSRVRDASKVALAALAARLQEWQFLFIDCQFLTDHLARLGAREISRSRYLKVLDKAISYPTIRGPWNSAFPPRA